VKRIGSAGNGGPQVCDAACCDGRGASCGCNVQPYVQAKHMSDARMGREIVRRVPGRAWLRTSLLCLLIEAVREERSCWGCWRGRRGWERGGVRVRVMAL
jgi:hypothetical protein